MRFFRKSLVGLMLLSLCLGLLAYAGQMVTAALQERAGNGKRTPQKRERMFTVNIVSAEPQSIAPVLEAFGEIQSRRSLDLRMAKGGQVILLSENFVEGGQVQAGEVLVQLRKSDAQSALARADADVIDAIAEVAEAQRALDLVTDELQAAREQNDLRQRAMVRQLDLKKRGVGTSAAVETAELAVSSTNQLVLSRRSAVDQVKARGAQAKTRLARAKLAQGDAKRGVADTALIAEFSGVLSGVSLVKGGLVSPNEKLGRLIDPDDLEVSVRISTEQYARLLDDDGRLISSPAKVFMDVSGSDLNADAILDRESGSVGAGQTGRVVFAALKEPRGLMSGDFVTLNITEPVQNYVMKFPASAVNANDELFFIGNEGRLQSQVVQVVRRQGNDVLVRARGLAGKEVVAELTPVLGAGIKVKAVKSDGASNLPEEPATVELSPERRAKLIAAIESNAYIPEDAKKRILKQLKMEKVPKRVVERIESRMGG
ncbi:MAG: efflux transporter periplasmic adaptor subunit [Aestuariivita sp.]|nr:efflux transporter periplasmic adaptor subunit [Aestuariivita sp.]